jgi:pimeloyl-ACP methyl ester carboxylesterase
MHETKLIDGVDVLIEGPDAGPGDETIVMIHGWPDTYRLWDAQVAALRAQYRCVRFTLPGFDVTKPRQAHSLKALVDTITRIVDQVSPDKKVTLLLHDWGCAFGYAYYKSQPERVARIIGVDIGDAGCREHVQSLPLKAKLMVAAYQLWLALAWRMGGIGGGSVGDRMTRSMARALGCRAEPQYMSSGMNYPYHIQWTGSLGGYPKPVAFEPACPMLYLYGRKKPFMFHSPQWVNQLARQPGNQVLAFDTGHWVMSQQPQAFNEAVLTWLNP